tara:strand:+ start:129 stop:398 length:270 start_codon:yes stop_codon:yes gene_type:complete
MCAMNEPKKKQRGRPKGSTSFVRVSMSDLLGAVGSKSNVVVSKKWLEEIGLTVAPAPVKVIDGSYDTKNGTQLAEQTEEKIEFSVTSFD